MERDAHHHSKSEYAQFYHVLSRETQCIWGDSRNSGSHHYLDWNNQSGLRTGLRLGSIENDRRWVCNFYNLGHRRMVRGIDICGQTVLPAYIQLT